MAIDFLPPREAELLNWATNFSTKITATPTAFGLVAGQATTFAGLLSSFQSAYALATNNATRSPMNIDLKNVAKDAMVANARVLAGVVQKFPAVTNAQRISLGLTVRAVPQPIPAPSSSPLIEVKGVSGLVVSMRLRDAASGSKRGRPPGVAGASVFSAVGATAPQNIADWKFEGNTTKTTVDVQFDSSLTPGTRVWVTAFWYSSRALSGPAATPVMTFVQGGGVIQQAA